MLPVTLFCCESVGAQCPSQWHCSTCDTAWLATGLTIAALIAMWIFYLSTAPTTPISPEPEDDSP